MVLPIFSSFGVCSGRYREWDRLFQKQKGEMYQMNISTIAQLAEVSTATVSRYLNNGYVSEEKRKRIQEVIERTGYRPSSSAQTLRTGRNNLIGVIVPKISSESVARMVDGITEVVNNAGYQVLLANTGNDTEKELEYLKTFRLNNVDGVIFIGTLMTKKHLALMKSYKKPIVLMGQQESEVSSVYFDDYGAAQLATDCLVRCGCKNIAHLAVTLRIRRQVVPEEAAIWTPWSRTICHSGKI